VGRRVLCSHCGRSFAAQPDTAVASANGSPHAVAVTARPAPIVAESLRESARTRGASAPQSAADMEPVSSPPINHQALWIGAILGGLLLLVGTTVGMVLYFATRAAPTDAPVEAAASAQEEANAPTSDSLSADTPRLLPPNRDDNVLPPPPSPERRNDPSPPSPPSPEPEQAAWLPPEEQEKVNKAIERGVQWLEKHQTLNGSWGTPHAVGLAALPALTLLECGVPADDARIRKAVNHVRKAIPQLNRTYELALVILFLDRLGDPADEKLIQTCALRLAAGQMSSGGWTYTCPLLRPAQEKNLLLVMQQTRPRSALDLFVAAPDGSPLSKAIQGESTESKLLAPGATLPLDAEMYKKTLDQLPPNLRNLPSLQPPGKAPKLPASDRSDNSNTQFAILGLSAAHKHDLPLERTLALIGQRFRTSQAPDGHWGYHYASRPQAGTPAMTGAGLLGLAVGLGLVADHIDPRARGENFKDPGVEKGFTFLGQHIGKPLGAKKPRAKKRTQINLYFLWTVERCGVLFQRREIAGKDWYRWGEELLLDHQQNDGSWMAGGYPGSMPVVDTCFALLFLKRANLAKNLTKKLEFFMEGKKLQGP
jgi:hypothetical protein